MQQLTRIVAAVVDTRKVVLYKIDGTTVEMHQGDTRLRPLLEHITPLLSRNGYADVDLNSENSWKEFEEKSSGFRFFKIAKEKLKNFFSGDPTDPVPPTVVGILPTSSSMVHRNENAVQEILKHAVPVGSNDFNDSHIAQQRPVVESGGHTPNDSRANYGEDQHYDKASQTIIAVTPDNKIVPGIERIKSQFAAAAKMGNVKGLEVFLTRIAKVIEKRQHTVEDLLRFMERGDLPVADDGTIVIYKKLTRRNGCYVDVHTGNVTQRVGSYVHMDEKLVDPNRRNECSNGLHVARRGYVGNFGGDVIVLAKVRPEDVIAVPDYDANKMRVCGYHIIAELTPAQYQAINGNRPISQAEGGAELLGNAIAGNHIGIIENVRIGSSRGGNLQVTPVEEEAILADPKATSTAKKRAKKAIRRKKKVIKKKAATVKPVKPLEASIAKTDKPVDVKQLSALQKGQAESLSSDPAPKLLTQADVVKALWEAALAGNKDKARELIAVKKAAKKGWSVWGLPDTAGETLKALLQ